VKVQAAVLCDFAEVREGLLSLLGGGVARVRRPAGLGPTPLPLYVGAIFEIEPDEIMKVHEIRVTVTKDGGGELGKVTAALQGAQNAKATLKPGEPALAAVAIPLLGIGIKNSGMYDVRISCDGGVPEIRTVYVSSSPIAPAPS
jgi:hypothetical protein